MRPQVDKYPSSLQRYFNLMWWFFEFPLLLERTPWQLSAQNNLFSQLQDPLLHPCPQGQFGQVLERTVLLKMHYYNVTIALGILCRELLQETLISSRECRPFDPTLSAEFLQDRSFSSLLLFRGIFTTTKNLLLSDGHWILPLFSFWSVAGQIMTDLT